MEIVAKAKNVRMSPRKVRQVVDLIKRLSLEDAREQLRFLTRVGARPVAVVLESAVANATKNLQLDEKDLTIKSIVVDEGFRVKRRDTSRNARADVGIIQKRRSHIKVTLQKKS